MNLTGKHILVTGAAGFIGFSLCRELLKRGATVVGIDNINSYYDPSLKEARLRELAPFPHFRCERIDLVHAEAILDLFQRVRPEVVLHVGAQAGVRYSLQAPHTYLDSNITGTLNILEGCRHYPVQHLLFASSSSVYGANQTLPYSCNDRTDHPVSLYAASKKANELMAYSYSHLFQIPTTGLRFFTVYGPWGRPDMAYFTFTQKILAGQPIERFNYGKHRRDFTYIDDIVESILRLIPLSPSTTPPYRLLNIGNTQPVWLDDFIATIEAVIGEKAIIVDREQMPGDVLDTFADVSELVELTGYRPHTTLDEGLRHFWNWYRSYYGI